MSIAIGPTLSCNATDKHYRVEVNLKTFIVLCRYLKDARSVYKSTFNFYCRYVKDARSVSKSIKNILSSLLLS